MTLTPSDYQDHLDVAVSNVERDNRVVAKHVWRSGYERWICASARDFGCLTCLRVTTLQGAEAASSVQVCMWCDDLAELA